MRLHSHASNPLSMSPYGAAGEPFAWTAVQEAYRMDRMDVAYRLAVQLGAGTMAYGLQTYRMIEAEWLTRGRSRTKQVTRFLRIESIPDAVADPSALENGIVAAFDATAARFGLSHSTPTLVTILAEEANTPWTPGRHGFCTPKVGFAKVCIPFYLLADEAELSEALRHEYAHVLSIGVAAGLCPMWLDEAIAMRAGGRISPEARSEFAGGALPWSTPARLDSAFKADRESESGRRLVWVAYQQAACLGYYLATLRSDASLGRLLAKHAGGFWARLGAVIRNELPVDVALRSVYGLTVKELFEAVLDDLRRDGGAKKKPPE
jgi:hypothetical protein